MKKYIVVGLSTLIIGCSNMNIAGMLDAGGSLFQAMNISDSDIKALGIQSAQKLDSENKIAPPNNAYTKRLNRIVKNLQSYNGQKLNYKVYLINQMNAFALPNGDIRVYSGLLDQLSDDEVLFVIGHEIGHVMEGHSKSQMRTNLLTLAARKAISASGNAIASSLSSGQIGDLAHNLIDSQYSQSQEYDADSYGLKVLKENGKSKDAAVSALKKIAVVSGNNSSIFSSHPQASKRADRIANMR